MKHSKITDKLIVEASVIRGYLCIFHYAFFFVKVKNDRLIREKKKGERERERERERMISYIFKYKIKEYMWSRSSLIVDLK